MTQKITAIFGIAVLVAILLGGLTLSQSAFAGASSEGNGQEKVTICHVDQETGEEETITVGKPAVRAHLANHEGDHLGPCVEEPMTCEEQCEEEFLSCIEGCQGDTFCEGLCEFFHVECVLSCDV